MKYRPFQAGWLLLTLTAAVLRADYLSTQLDVALTQKLPYKYAGIIVNTTGGDRGSGAVVGNPRIVIACAHLPFTQNATTKVWSWSTDNLWFRAYESSTVPLTRSAGQALRGYWKFDSYATLISSDGQATLQSEAVDFTAFYGYEDLGPGSARYWYDGQSALVSPSSKIIVGYPAGNYPSGDGRANLMHQAGPFALAFTQLWGNYNGIDGVATGPGNSGGPVFVTDETSLAADDQGWRFAAVLVTGEEVANGDAVNLSGVVAVTAADWDLVDNSLNAIAVAPLNDSWSGAMTIFGDVVTETSNNQFATKEPGEPNHAGNSGGHSIWWRWVAPGDGPVAVDTTGSIFNTLLGVYTGGSVSSLTAVASNDDSPGGVTSATNFAAVAGTKYWIAVDGKNGATGPVTMHLNFTPPAPPNDAFASATDLSGFSTQVTGHNINATKEPGEPDHAGNAGGKSVWWRWTAPADGSVFLTTSGTGFDTLLAVYTGSTLNALSPVASNDDPAGTASDSSTLTFPAVGNTTYWIAVDGFSNATHPAGSGAISLSLALTPGAPVIAVQPLGETPAPGAPVTLAVASRGAAPLSYQWYKDGVAIPGATTARYTIGSFQTTDAGHYTVVVTNSQGSAASNDAPLRVILPDQAFVQQLFIDVLGRAADPGGLANFLAILQAGSTRAAVLGDLYGSAEYTRRQIEPVIRLYYAALARPPDFAGLQNWSGALQLGALTLTGAADHFASSAEFQLRYGSLDNTGYVQQLYRNVLGREADTAGLASWVDQLNAGSSRGTVLVGFSESDEFKADLADQVEIVRLYCLLLQRMPTASELQDWIGFLKGYGQTDTLFAQAFPTGLADSDYVRLVFRGFLRRDADAGALGTFGSALAAGTATHGSLVDMLLNSTEFNLFVAPVSRLYLAALRRVPDAPGLDNWVNYVRAGNSLQAMADAFAASQEFTNRYGAMSNADYVAQLYRDVLGREGDVAGLAHWTALLDSGGTTRGQILIGFSESQEAIHLFAPTLRTFLHYFAFFNAPPAQQDLDSWRTYLATLTNQMRQTLLDDPVFSTGG